MFASDVSVCGSAGLKEGCSAAFSAAASSSSCLNTRQVKCQAFFTIHVSRQLSQAQDCNRFIQLVQVPVF